MADFDNTGRPIVTKKTKKRQIVGRKRDLLKIKRLTSHVVGESCHCARLRCFENTTSDERNELVAHFNSLLNKDQQDSFLAKFIQVNMVKRRRARRDGYVTKLHDYSYQYHVSIARAGKSERVPVCISAFVSIFGITKSRVERIRTALANSGLPPTDNRGKHANRPHAFTADQLNRMTEHIQSFCGFHSHYSLKDTQKVCHPEELNVKKMHQLFMEKYPDENISYESYRSLKWLVNLHQADLSLNNISQKKTCSCHLEATAYNHPSHSSTSRLSTFAIPTIMQCPNPQSLNGKQKRPTKCKINLTFPNENISGEYREGQIFKYTSPSKAKKSMLPDHISNQQFGCDKIKTMENVGFKFIPNLMLKESDVSKTDIETDFQKQLIKKEMKDVKPLQDLGIDCHKLPAIKKEINDDVNSVNPDSDFHKLLKKEMEDVNTSPDTYTDFHKFPALKKEMEDDVNTSPDTYTDFHKLLKKEMEDVNTRSDTYTDFHKLRALKKEINDGVSPKPDVDPDFHKLKKEMDDKVNPRPDVDIDCLIIDAIKQESVFHRNREVETSSKLTLSTECVSNNISRTSNYQVAFSREKPTLTSCGESVNEQHAETIISSNLDPGQANSVVSEGVNSCKIKYKSGTCNEFFYDIEAYQKSHVEIKYNNYYNWYSAFAKSQNLTAHKIQHSEDKLYECDICFAAFAQLSNLTLHKRRCTGKKSFKCDICNVAFVKNAHLTVHKRLHTEEKPYKCDICSATFAQNSHLTVHKRRHTGEKPYKCDMCSVGFAQRSHLTVHKRRHTGEKPYKCENCSAAFSNSTKLTEHKRKHTGEKPYKCDYCSATFAQNSYLTLHKRRHGGRKPFTCDICSATFAECSSLIRHKRRHTVEKPYT